LPKPAAKTGYAPPPLPSPAEFGNARVALLATRWNVEVVERLLAGSRRALAEWGVTERQVREFRVPGAFELPLAATAVMRRGRYAAVVALGAVVRGDTPHFDFVAGECARGLREASQKYRVALGFGVLTVDTPAQALARAGRGRDNKGYEAAVAALEMLRLLRTVDG
jgi:6,7-dimethyl-8-ribityllumazine synthase